MSNDKAAVERTPEEWQKELTRDQFHVLREHGTERPGSSPLNYEKRPGTFACAGCGQPLFSSDTKFESGTGWPSFWSPLEGGIGTSTDRSFFMTRTEVHCARCGGHLGHVFPDGPPPTGLRYCMNGVALDFTADEQAPGRQPSHVPVESQGRLTVADIDSHHPGTFSWPELTTSDQKAAVVFYRDLFGWGLNEQPVGPDQVYSMFQLRGRDVAAASSMQPAQREQGVPPYWGLYVATTSADVSVAKATSLGATVLAPPFDVMDVGRMAILQDPTGAMISLWQARKHIGARVLNEPGALCWAELSTKDPAAAEKFYTGLFGWTVKSSAMGDVGTYTEFSADGTAVAGMMKMPAGMENAPSYWMPYFFVASCNAAVARAKELGAQVYVPPTDIPGERGRFAILADPQGAAFGVFTRDGQ
jgi:hypothetical protein